MLTKTINIYTSDLEVIVKSFPLRSKYFLKFYLAVA